MSAKKNSSSTKPKTRFSPKPTMRKPRKTAVRKTTTKPRPAIPVARPPVTSSVKNYIFAVGRRKEAVARVRWFRLGGDGRITVNGRPLDKYFSTIELQQTVRSPFLVSHLEDQATVSVKVKGGGVLGQAEAVRLGIARALVKSDPDLRLGLKQAGFLRRDPRVKERKKYGLKRARRAPQWQKR